MFILPDYKQIHGIDVEKIMEMKECTVHGPERKQWRAKCYRGFSEDKDCLFFLDDFGRLTGQYVEVSRDQSPVPPEPEPIAPTVEDIISPDKGHRPKKEKRKKTRNANDGTDSLDIEAPADKKQNAKKKKVKQPKEKPPKLSKAEKKAKREEAKEAKKASASSETAASAKQKESGSAKMRFHTGAFLLGMGVVLFAMIAYFVIQFAIYEGLI